MKIMILEILRNIKENLTNPSTTTTLLFLFQQYTCKKRAFKPRSPSAFGNEPGVKTATGNKCEVNGQQQCVKLTMGKCQYSEGRALNDKINCKNDD